MKILEDETFYQETTSDRIAGFVGVSLSFFFIIISLLLIISVFTIAGVEVASWIWGDHRVIYWIADNF